MGTSVTVHMALSREVFWHVYAKSRDIQAKIPLPQAIWNEFWLVAVNGVNCNEHQQTDQPLK